MHKATRRKRVGPPQTQWTGFSSTHVHTTWLPMLANMLGVGLVKGGSGCAAKEHHGHMRRSIMVTFVSMQSSVPAVLLQPAPCELLAGIQ